MTTHLLRFDPDLQRASQWMAVQGLTASGQADDGYGWHALLCAVFGKANAPNLSDFSPGVAGWSNCSPIRRSALAELIACAANCADPKAYTALRVDRLASKKMPPIFARTAPRLFSPCATYRARGPRWRPRQNPRVRRLRSRTGQRRYPR